MFICKTNSISFAMNKCVLKHVILLTALLFVGCYAQAQNEASPKNGWFANRPKKLNLELKVGRGFLGETATEESARLFYGGGSLSYGLMLGKNYVGLGAGAEYYSMELGSFDFPVFLNVQHYFSKDYEKGFFIGAKLGYMFSGKKSIPTVEHVTYQEDPVNATRERSMKGLYWDVEAGYRFSNLSLFVSYNYRVIGYEIIIYPNEALAGIHYKNYSRTMHTVMAGISIMLF